MKQPSEGRSKYVVVGMLLLVLSPLAYFLSIGPAVWLNMNGYMSESVTEGLTVFYLPISWLAEHSTAFGQLLTWYLRCWVGFG